MRYIILTVSFVALSFALEAAGPPAKQETPEDKQIAKLIGELGSEEWRVREKASAKLKELGRKPRAALLEAVKSEDLEVATRARRLLAPILNDEVWDPVEISVSAKKRKVSEIFASIGEKSGTVIAWGPLTGHGEAPEDARIDFEAKGTLPDVLDQLCKKSGTRVVCPDGYCNTGLRVVTASKDAMPKVNSGNVWVTVGSTPFTYGDGTVSVSLQVISGGTQALAGLSVPLEVKATTDTGETIGLSSKAEFDWIEPQSPNRVVSVRLELSPAKKPYKKIVKLEIEATLKSFGDPKVVSFDVKKPSERKQFGRTFECGGLKPYGVGISTVTAKVDRYIHGSPRFELFDVKGNKVTAHYVADETPWNASHTTYGAYFDSSKLVEPSRVDMHFFGRTAYKKVNVTLRDIVVR